MSVETKPFKYQMKPLFEERMRKLIPDEKDFIDYSKIIHQKPLRFIRCNTLKISTIKLFERLNKKWKVIQPYETNPEIMLIKSEIEPGGLGNAIEHLLGYY